MNTSNVVTAPPGAEPVSLALLKSHLRVDHDDEDNLITMYGMTARVAAERYMNRALINTGFLYTVQPDVRARVPGYSAGPLRYRHPIELPRSPLVRIVSVATNDIAGNAATIPSAAYVLEAATDPARLRLDYASNLITPVAPLLSIQIAYVAGYGTDATNIPPTMINAILIGAAFFYENRGDEGGELPKAAQWLLDMDRVSYFGG